MQTFYDVLPKFHQGFMIINYDTLSRYELVRSQYGSEYIRVTYHDGETQIFRTESIAFSHKDITGKNWGVGLRA